MNLKYLIFLLSFSLAKKMVVRLPTELAEEPDASHTFHFGEKTLTLLTKAGKYCRMAEVQFDYLDCTHAPLIQGHIKSSLNAFLRDWNLHVQNSLLNPFLEKTTIIGYTFHTKTGALTITAEYDLNLSFIESFAFNKVSFSLYKTEKQDVIDLAFEFQVDQNPVSKISYDFKNHALHVENMETLKKKIHVGETNFSFEIALNDLHALPRFSSQIEGSLLDLFNAFSIDENQLPTVFRGKLDRQVLFDASYDLQSNKYSLHTKLQENVEMGDSSINKSFTMESIEFQLNGKGKHF